MEMLRQAFLLPLTEVAVIKKVIGVFHGWIQEEENPPIFAQDPMLDRLDGKPHEFSIRAGSQILLLSFISASARVFLIEQNADNPKLIDAQVNIAKMVLNVYRYAVLNCTMDDGSWNQLLLVVLYITRHVLGVEKGDEQGLERAKKSMKARKASQDSLGSSKIND